MANNGFSFGQNDGEIVSRRRDAWKAEDGKDYLATLAWFPGMENGTPDFSQLPLFDGAETNYFEGAGHVLNGGPEFTALANGEAPKLRLGTIICLWPLDSNGDLDASNISKVSVRAWSPGVDKYETMKKLHKSYPLNKSSITISCEDKGAKFQKLKILPAGESVLIKVFSTEKLKPLQEKIAKAVASIIPDIPGIIGKKMTIQQLREKLGKGGGSPTNGFGGGGLNLDGLDEAVSAIADL